MTALPEPCEGLLHRVASDLNGPGANSGGQRRDPQDLLDETRYKRAEGRGGEGGSRTHGDLATTPVFKTGPQSAQAVANKGTYDSGNSDLASHLALLAEKSPGLAAVVKAWPSLPEAVRAGILAMVKVAEKAGR